MDETAILWIFGAMLSVQVAVVGFLGAALWRHLEHCREVQRMLGELSTLPAEISRIRRHLHDDRNTLMRLTGVIKE